MDASEMREREKISVGIGHLVDDLFYVPREVLIARFKVRRVRRKPLPERPIALFVELMAHYLMKLWVQVRHDKIGDGAFDVTLSLLTPAHGRY
jgi:hypothetical protein